MTGLRKARLRPCAAGIRNKRAPGNAAWRAGLSARTFYLPDACEGEQHQCREPGYATPIAIFAEASTTRLQRTTFGYVMPIERRNATMTTNSLSPTKLRADTGLGRTWRLVTSFFALAARSLPAAGV